MDEPSVGPGEVTSEPLPVQQPRTVTPRQFLIGSAIAVIVLAAASVTVLELASPHYKRPWCASVEATLDNTSQTQGQYETALSSEGAPVAQLLSDAQAYDAANANEQEANNFQALGAIAQTEQAVEVIGNDLRQIDRECGVPQSAAGHQGI
jgi:hypothetical protein